MAIASNFPAIKPSLSLDFANTKRLDSRVTFTRTTTATYYDGVTTAKAEENLLLQSQDFATSWSVAGTNATVTSNTTAAPDGTTTADTLTDDATSGVHRVGQSLTTSNTNQMVYSVFAKYSTLQWISISLSTSPGTWAGAKFDVQNGVLGSTSQQGTGFTANSSSITAVGNGWYRCVLVLTPGASGSTIVVISGATDGTTFTTSQRGSEVYSGTGSEVFLWGAQLEQRSAVTAYTPTTTQPITNYIPVLLTAASGVARFDHNPTTDESLGLLIEESRTNLFTYSEQFDNAIWTKNAGTLTTNTLVAPDGTLTADLFFEDTAAAQHVITHNLAPSFTSGTTYTQSYFVKAGGRTRLQINFRSDWFPVNVEVNFDLVAKTATPAANATGTIQEVGNGWFRITATATADATGTSPSDTFLYLADASGNTNYTGDGYSGIYIWGAQLEAGAFATSYIATTSATVTRNADAASMTGTNFSSWYNQGEGTLYIESALAGNSINRNAVSISDGTSNNEITLRWSSSSLAQFLVDVGAVAQVSIAPAGYSTIGTFYRRAAAYRVNDFEQAISGTSVGTDTIGTIPVVSQMQFANPTGTVDLCGYIRKFAYYPLRLTGVNLQALTS